MPSRLKLLELTGYKTFASKSQFLFGDHITCIVGPNGSGKSNVADSIRWVLGEQSFSLLRGKKTEDMIFSGSEQRPRANLAQATVTFDNSDGWLPIDFAEVSITRRAYRDGTNEYLLNGQRARLRDINELLGKVGLAERTYTIVGQGAIDTALSLKAEERRALFEEAAGIGIYRHKREDALRKLEQTQHNLERVHDILAEIKPRLKTLERQAQRARDYQQVKAELDGVLKTWYGYHWHTTQEALAQSHLSADEQTYTLDNLRGEQGALDSSLADLRSRIANVRGQLNHWQAESFQLREQAEVLNRNLAVADERLRAFADQRESLAADLRSLESDRATELQAHAATQAEFEKLQSDQAAAQTELQTLEAARQQRESERKRIADEANVARNQADALQAQINQLNAQRTQLAAEADRLAQSQADQQVALEQAQSTAGQKQAIFNQQESAYQAAAQRLAEADAEIQRLAERLSRTEQQLATASNSLTEALTAEGRITARAEALSQLRAAVEGGSGLAALRQAGSAIGLQAELADVVTAPPDLEALITQALGQFVNAAIVEQPNPALDLLTNTQGRAALLSVAGAKPANLPALPDHPDLVGIAAQLVTCSEIYRPVVNALLGGIVIVKSQAAALYFQTILPADAVALTLAGEFFYGSGAILAGRESQTDTASTLALAREQRELPLAIQQAQAERQNLEAQRDTQTANLRQHQADRDTANLARRALQTAEREAAAARDAARLDLERAQSQVTLHQTQVADYATRQDQTRRAEQSLLAELETLNSQAAAAAEAARLIATQSLNLTADELNDQIATRQMQAAVAARAATDAAARLAERQTALDRSQSAIQARRARLDALALEAENFIASLSQDRTSLANLQAQLSSLQSQVEPAQHQLGRLEIELASVESSETQMRASLHASERRHADLQLEYARKKDELENLRRQITDDFGLVALDYSEEMPGPVPLPLEGVVEHLPRIDQLPEGTEDLLNRRRGQLKRMGAINPDALAEFTEVRERHEFLTTQVIDLEAAATQLREIIAELDALMEREFRRTFDAVAEQFKDTFGRLFGGGTAKLILTEPDNLTNTGIDILARLPGRKQQGLALLSGGERALTASALLFALLKVNPPPFAMMDEVDAALDEANVGRFRDLLRELSTTTQFVVITHNRNTVQAAEVVYGISMGSDSASQAISLKLDGEKVVQN